MVGTEAGSRRRTQLFLETSGGRLVPSSSSGGHAPNRLRKPKVLVTETRAHCGMRHDAIADMTIMHRKPASSFADVAPSGRSGIGFHHRGTETQSTPWVPIRPRMLRMCTDSLVVSASPCLRVSVVHPIRHYYQDAEAHRKPPVRARPHASRRDSSDRPRIGSCKMDRHSCAP